MFQCLYIEEEILSHPQTRRFCERFAHLPHIICKRYGEIFNRRRQNFRLQKEKPSLILAKKFDHFVLETPDGYGIGGKRNFYFSHMLNCIYDCRYCFLQGMYQSAHHVVFVNFEDFQQAIEAKIQEAPLEPSYFFSGYDCDSLALEPLTHFVENMLPFFASRPNAYLELRTKSINTQFLLQRSPLANCIVAFSLTPKEISEALEHKTPPLARRLKALQQLQEKGWPIGLRFDPLIYCDNFKDLYHSFFEEVFSLLDATRLHSVSLGAFRLPKAIYKNIASLYPNEKLFAHSLEERAGHISYRKSIEKDLISHCQEELMRYIPSAIFFPCQVPA